MTWRLQLDKAINKAYKAFWICRCTFRKTWGLGPKIVYWIYTAVLRPIVTYAATKLWQRVKLKKNQAELSKLKKDGLLGNNRSNENGSNTCNGSPPFSPPTAFAGGGRGQDRELLTTLQRSKETSILRFWTCKHYSGH
jgi:hypothetical protein